MYFVSMKREREGGGDIIVSRQTEIPRLSRLVYYGRKSLRLSVRRTVPSIISARKRALIIARYQICIRLQSARFFSLLASPSSSPLRVNFALISISFDIDQFGRLLCSFNTIYFSFFFVEIGNCCKLFLFHSRNISLLL